MATWFVLSTQGKSGILSGKGGQGRARSNVAPECPPGQQSRTRAVDGTLIQRSRTVKGNERKGCFPEQQIELGDPYLQLAIIHLNQIRQTPLRCFPSLFIDYLGSLALPIPCILWEF
ncbi:hypothetical protein RHMOL_RhmolMtG0007500 (mitochondrion) [Rhododendron molle]|nr:hypothetical protein RHMOL_RhmolMtG0007500 [Rhododendron molle]